MRVFICILMTALSAPLFAVPIIVSDIKAEWGQADPNTGVMGVGTERLKWGSANSENGKSSLEWQNGLSSPNSVGDWEVFSIGSIEHTSKSSERSDVFHTSLIWSIDVEIDGTLFNDISFEYDVWHSNSQTVQQEDEGGSVWVGDEPKWEIMYLNGEDYLLKVYGFNVDGAMITGWYTSEADTTTATLLGSVSRVTIPEPQTYLLLGSLLSLVALCARRRQQQAART